MMARYFPKPFNESNCAHLSQSSDVMLSFLPVPIGILCGARSNFFSFWCWLVSSCVCLMCKRAFEFGIMNPAALPKSMNKAVTMAILFCCCSDKPSMWKTLGLISLKGKAKLSLLWELKAEDKEGVKKGFWLLFGCGCRVSGLDTMTALVGQSKDLWWRLCCHQQWPAANSCSRTGWGKSQLLSSPPCSPCGDLRSFQNQMWCLCLQ